MPYVTCNILSSGHRSGVGSQIGSFGTLGLHGEGDNEAQDRHKEHDSDHQASNHRARQLPADRALDELVLRRLLAATGLGESTCRGEGVAAAVGVHERGKRSIVNGDLQRIRERGVGLSGGLDVHSVVNGSLRVTGGHDSAATATVVGHSSKFNAGNIVKVDSRQDSRNALLDGGCARIIVAVAIRCFKVVQNLFKMRNRLKEHKRNIYVQEWLLTWLKPKKTVGTSWAAANAATRKKMREARESCIVLTKRKQSRRAQKGKNKRPWGIFVYYMRRKYTKRTLNMSN